MKFLGHAWVAVNSVKNANRDLLILGSILPEINPYISKIFTYQQLHEVDSTLIKYTKHSAPELTDLSLGMITHSVKLGADRFNEQEKLTILGYKAQREILNRIMSTLKVNYKASKVRAHNVYELAVDLTIINNNPNFVDEFVSATNNKSNAHKAAKMLAEYFNKPIIDADKCVNQLTNMAQPHYFKNSQGLANLWAELTRNFDPKPDIHSLAKLIAELSDSFHGREKKFLSQCIARTSANIAKLTNK